MIIFEGTLYCRLPFMIQIKQLIVKSCTFLTETLQGAQIMKPVKISLVQERTSRSPVVSSLMFSRSRLAFRV